MLVTSKFWYLDVICLITKCDSYIHYKVRQLVITECDSYFIVKCDNFITKCDRCYQMRRLLQSATVHHGRWETLVPSIRILTEIK